MTIGRLARDTATKVVTIRYYESIGLLPAPPRTASNYRLYDADHKARLDFIRRCRELGFGLEPIRELLDLSTDTARDCAQIDRIAREHLSTVEAKMRQLEILAAQLRRISEQCDGGRIANCRILEALSG